MRRLLTRAGALAALVVLVPHGSRADSVFGIRGLGILGRPLSARVLGTGGAFGLFDAATALSPASLGLWRTPAGWAVGAASRRQYGDGAAGTTLTSTRFPLFGFASPLGQRAVIALSVGDFLDRTWAVSTSRDTVLRDSAVTFEDHAASFGGVSDLRVGVAYRLTDGLTVGIGLHALTGSTRQSVQRSFSVPDYESYYDLAVADFTGTGFSFGGQVRLSSRVSLAGMARLNGRLRASASGGIVARVSMPSEVAGGVVVSPVAGALVAVSAGYQSWDRASAALVASGEQAARNVTNFSAGGEFDVLRVAGRTLPVRLGYRTRQLPFQVNGAWLDEHAVTGGLGIILAGGRATLDIGFEKGTRSASGARERFTTGIVGVIVRP